MIAYLAALLLQPATANGAADPPSEIPVEVVETIAGLPGPERDSERSSAEFAEFVARGLFDPARDAEADVEAALTAARASGKHVLIVFGGSWCHDSVALIDVMFQSGFVDRLADRYELAFVNVPLSRTERAIPVAHRLGLGDIEGTPTVLILRPDGTPVNLDEAQGWRNAASRKPAAIHRALERAAPPVSAAPAG
jgi:thioredoxin-like negative regulator of GroEL